MADSRRGTASTVAMVRRKLGLPANATEAQIIAAIERLPGSVAAAARRPGGPPVEQRDRRRWAGEDVISYCTATGRFAHARAAHWRTELAAGRISEAALEGLAPALQVNGPGVAASASTYAPTVSASIPAGADPAGYATNPLVDSLLAQPYGQQIVNDACAAAGGQAVTLFESGDLPPFTASGIDPSVLAALPWRARHAIAEEPDQQSALELVEAVSGPDGDAVASTDQRFAGNASLGGYLARFNGWVSSGNQYYGARERRKYHDANKPAPVAASAASSEEMSDDEVWEASGLGHIERQKQQAHEEFLEHVEKGLTVGGWRSHRKPEDQPWRKRA